MKKRIILALTCFFYISVAALAQSKTAILGKWVSEHGHGEIEIYEKGDKFFGRIVTLALPGVSNNELKDNKNPDYTLRNRSIIGMDVLSGLIYKGNGVWEDGSIYNPKTGKTYRCKITLQGDTRLAIRGFVGVSMMGKTEIWKRGS